MGNPIKRILSKLNNQNLLTDLSEKLPGSDFSSLLLEIFKLRAGKVTPTQLLSEFENNRFVAPATIDTIKNLELQCTWLKIALQRGFVPVTLSPVAPLGSCSIVGTVNQNKVLSSVRGTEVVADATNVLALKIAQDFKRTSKRDTLIRYSTMHRHIRGQSFDNPNFTPHFGIFCMASGGFDRGSYAFELQQLNDHIGIILELLTISFPAPEVRIKFSLKEQNEALIRLLRKQEQAWSHLQVDFETDFSNKYYKTIQFKMFVILNGEEVNIADGGMVDWTQQLLGNKKHRTLISGVGIELAQKLMS